MRIVFLFIFILFASSILLLAVAPTSNAASTCTCNDWVSDSARSRNRIKRGGSLEQVSLDEALTMTVEHTSELLDLDEALTALARLDERQSQIVELRFFGGLTEAEIAEVMKLSERTIQSDWRLARSWLLRELSGEKGNDA